MVNKCEKEILNLPFTGITSFVKYPICTDLSKLEADVAVIGAPYDLGTNWRSGARFGPRGVRVASALYSFGLKGFYDPERDDTYIGPSWRVVDCGDIDMVNGDLQQCFDNIRASIRQIIARGAMPVLIGGDHSVTIPYAEALEDLGPFYVVQLDAHLDWCDQRSGQRYGQGSPMRRLSEMKHVQGTAQIGIRGLGSSSKEDFDHARGYGSVIVSPRELREIGIQGVMDRIPDAKRYFITIDVDVLDPSLAPGTGTPSPGGLDYYEVNGLMEGLAKKGEIIAFDFVEVAPIYDPTETTSLISARLILDFIGFILKEREKNR
ncbi:MAG TPA: agmatinase [Clostridia bacterium]|jgi:agmatinase|nr:agmatinase [Clostridia bacterium]